MTTWTARASPSPVHPHERGEDRLSRVTIRRAAGSSPRAWGRCIQRPGGGRTRRFIPTSVGKIPPAPHRWGRWPVHPHERGEDTYRSSRCDSFAGSSPRAWGRCISKSSAGSPLAVHPHERGEDLVQSALISPSSGSSPRAWGRFTSDSNLSLRQRFIPTSVGKIIAWLTPCSTLPVHPHERGEDGSFRNGLHESFGSSPRAWGRF